MTSAIYDLTGRRVFVAGHRGMVGSAIVRRLASEGCEIIVAPRTELDLRDIGRVKKFLTDNQVDTLFMAGAKVGGILANATYPADFLSENLEIACSTIRAAHEADVEKLLFLGSTCIYPKMAPQPIVESALLSGPLEPTNEAYALAKIAGVKLCQAYRTQHGRDFISAMPTNLYGTGDNYDLQTSHVLPALIAKAHQAKMQGDPGFVVWGSGAPRREFLHADDCADALVFLMKHWSESEQINVGTGEDISIAELAALVKRVVGFEGAIEWDASKPDGTPRKLVDVSKLGGLGWTPQIGLEDGIARTYCDFIPN